MNAALEVFGISVQEVARLLGVSVSHVYRLGAMDETFPKPRMVGRARRYDPREVRDWFDAQCVEGSIRRGDRKKGTARNLRVSRPRTGDAGTVAVVVSPAPRSGFSAAKRLPSGA